MYRAFERVGISTPKFVLFGSQYKHEPSTIKIITIFFFINHLIAYPNKSIVNGAYSVNPIGTSLIIILYAISIRPS